MIWDRELPYFSKSELACKGTGIIKLDIRFAVALVNLRHEWGKSLTPSSVCRTPNHNRNEGGHVSSLHLTDNPKHPSNGTMAADFTWKAWPKDEQLKFAKFAYYRGWSVGLHNSFIHVDRRVDIGLPQAVFLYGSWDNRFKPSDV